MKAEGGDFFVELCYEAQITEDEPNSLRKEVRHFISPNIIGTLSDSKIGMTS